MKDMIKKVREERGGFTLAELLIVVAIILVLVAIAVPVFMGAQDRAETAVAEADIRAAKGAAATKYLLDGETADGLYYTVTVSADGDLTSVGDSSASGSESTVDEVKAGIKAGNGFDITVKIVGTDLDLAA